MTFELLSSVIAGLVAALLGLVTSLLSARYRERARRQQEELEKLAEAYSAHAERLKAELEGQRARVAETLASKVPPETDIPSLIAAIRTAVSESVIGAQRPELEPEPDRSWDVVEDLVQGYHRQALDQAKVQFWFSVAAATVGFGLIIFMATTATTAQNVEFVLKVLPGAIISSVAALFFRQAGETRQRATALYDRLRSDSQKRQALELVANIEDQTVRSVVKAQLALHMAGLQVDNLDAAALVLKMRGRLSEESA